MPSTEPCIREYQKDTDIKESKGPQVPPRTYRICSGFVTESRYWWVLSRDADIVPSTLHVVSNRGGERMVQACCMYMSVLVNPRAYTQGPNQNVRCLPLPFSTYCLETGSPTELSSPFKTGQAASTWEMFVCFCCPHPHPNTQWWSDGHMQPEPDASVDAWNLNSGLCESKHSFPPNHLSSLYAPKFYYLFDCSDML